jgi:hypothetical protein
MRNISLQVIFMPHDIFMSNIIINLDNVYEALEFVDIDF